MAALVAAIHDTRHAVQVSVDGRDKPGHYAESAELNSSSQCVAIPQRTNYASAFSPAASSVARWKAGRAAQRSR
jgi:hypothetical protein